MCNCYPSNHCGSAPYTMQPGAYSNAVDCTCFLGIATVPWQQFTNSYEPEQAFMVAGVGQLQQEVGGGEGGRFRIQLAPVRLFQPDPLL